MANEDVIETISKLPGVGRKKAEAIVAAGFDSMEKLKAASVEELQAAEGIGPKVAQAIIDGLAELETPTEKTEVEVVEAPVAKKTKGKEAKAEKKKAEAEEKAEVVEPEAVYRPKIKADIPQELKRALEIREIRKDQEPEFSHYHRWHSKRVPHSWRAPKGVLSKQRRGFKYRPPRVKIGYGKPALARGLHPSGFEEVMVANPEELDLVDPKTQAARIVGTVGARKRKLIEEAAAEKSIRVLNPTTTRRT